MSLATAPTFAPETLDHHARAEGTRRRNALNARKHGMTARFSGTEDEAAAMKQFADRWTKELGPDTEAQEGLIRASATAFARVERCRKIEEETMAQSAIDAVARWEKTKRHKVRAKAQELDADPVNTVADLECSSFGCEWIMRHWLRLDAKLAQGVDWDKPDLYRAMTLFGFFPKAPKPNADKVFRHLWGLGRLATGSPVASVDGPPSEEDADAARVELRARIASEFRRLDRIREELWESLDGPESEAVARKEMVDSTKEGQLRRRYAREAFSEMTRGINLVMRIRVENGKFADRLWWQAHAEHRKPRNSSPFHHPQSMPTCLIPDPRPAAPEPSEPPESCDHRNEPPNEDQPTKHQLLISYLQNGLREDDPAEPPVDIERSLPPTSAEPTLPDAPISPLVDVSNGARWPSAAPSRA